MSPTSTLVHGSLLGLVALLHGCENPCQRLPSPADEHHTGPGQPPRIIGGEFLGGTVVQLAFSEPLASVDAVDPEKFRLGVVALDASRKHGRCERTIHYCDLTLDFDECSSQYGYGGYGYGYGQPPMSGTRVTSLELDDHDASLLELRIDPPLTEKLCLQLDDTDLRVGIHVFFSSADVPSIEDLDGEPLAEIAPRWVVSGEDSTTRAENFDGLKHWLPIPCPEHF